MKAPLLIAALVGLLASTARADLSKGIERFEQHRWAEAMGEFLSILREDPQNTQAHEYLTLAAQQMEAEQRAATRDRRLELLGDASKRLDNNRLDSTPLQTAISETTQAEENDRRERWRAQCVMAVMEQRRGHLAAANDYVFRVLAEDSGHPEAQRLLSDLQSQIHTVLDAENLPASLRMTLEGFYAYGQADYRTALAAWVKTRTTIQQSFSPEEASQQIAALHFDAYEKIAQAHVAEEDRSARVMALFQQAMGLYEKGSYDKARDAFRQVALINPDHPQLGAYLVQSEAAAEKERTRRLSQDTKDRASEAFTQGLAALEHAQYPQARLAFQQVLAQDPTHPQARSYLSVVEAEMSRRHDPRAAQLHYEAGLIAYASGKLPEAVREWSIATRLDPGLQKATNALSKVQKEMALYREVPG